MNKDVITITPEDDITDVIAQIKASEKKIVAIIPPQPAGILRSAVNIKLIAKVSEEAEKVSVFVTSDPAILKLASEIHVPIAEDLNSRPYIPTKEEIDEIVKKSKSETEIAEDFVAPIESDEDDEEEDEEKPKKSSKTKKSKKETKEKEPGKLVKKFPWLKGKGKLIAVISVSFVLIVGFLVWAFVIAPSADIYVRVSVNNSSNFSENVTFTENESSEDVASGKFHLKKVSKDFKQRQNFTATGKKDLGDKASGELTVALFFKYDEDSPSTIKVPSGTKFALGDLSYVSTKEVIYGFDYDDPECENIEGLSGKEVTKTLKNEGCQVTKTIFITASDAGEKYNISDTHENWTTSLKPDVSGIGIANFEKISGGTSKIVTIVTESDVEEVKKNLLIVAETDGKNQLYDSISDTSVALEPTLKIEEATFEVTPAVGEEVKEGITPVVVITKPFSIDTISYDEIEEFIKAKTKLPEDQKVYSFGEPFFENLTESNEGYYGKLKTTYRTGPNITEESIFEKSAGKSISDTKKFLRSIQGVESVEINTSVLLNYIPTEKDRVKITIDFGEYVINEVQN